MKIIPILLYMLLCFVTTTKAQTGIGTQAPHSSSVLQVASSTKGVLYPRMTRTQMLAIASPAEGLVVYSTTDDCPHVYNGTKWASLCNRAAINSFAITGVSLVTAQLTHNTRTLLGSYTFTVGVHDEEVRVEGIVSTNTPTGLTNDRSYKEYIETEFVNNSNVRVGETCATTYFNFPRATTNGNVTGTLDFPLNCSMVFSAGQTYTVNIYAKVHCTSCYTGWTINSGAVRLIRKNI